MLPPALVSDWPMRVSICTWLKVTPAKPLDEGSAGSLLPNRLTLPPLLCSVSACRLMPPSNLPAAFALKSTLSGPLLEVIVLVVPGAVTMPRAASKRSVTGAVPTLRTMLALSVVPGPEEMIVRPSEIVPPGELPTTPVVMVTLVPLFSVALMSFVKTVLSPTGTNGSGSCEGLYPVPVKS